MPLYDRSCNCGWQAIDVWEPVYPETPPTCPQCGTETVRAWLSRTSHVNGDECDIVQENGFSEPQRFTSKAELNRALSAKGLEMHVRHVPLPGTDKSPHTTDWSKGSMDAHTLENARILVARAGQLQGTTEPEPDVPVTWTVREWGE